MQIYKIIYLSFAIPVGFGLFYALMIIFFNSGDSLLTKDNKPVAMLAGFSALLGISLYLLIGRVIYKSHEHIPKTLVLIIISLILYIPVITIWNDIKDSLQDLYSNQHENKYISELQKEFASKIYPLEFDYKTSNHDSNYYDQIKIILHKTNGERISNADVDKVIELLPSTNNEVYIWIFNSNVKDSPGRKYIFRLEIRSNMPMYCNTDDYEHSEICDKYFNLGEAIKKKYLNS